jgi:hypothetical protein
MKFVAVAVLLFTIYGCRSQTATPDPRIAELENQVTTLKAQNADFQNMIADLQKQRDECSAKFSRFTFLYDVGLFNVEARAWVIPADVEPVLATNKVGTYSHYDPKTQVETVHFRG